MTKHAPKTAATASAALIALAALEAENHALLEQLAEMESLLAEKYTRYDELPDYPTVEQAAAYLRMAPKTLRNRLSLGDAPPSFMQRGRRLFAREDLRAYVEAARCAPNSGTL